MSAEVPNDEQLSRQMFNIELASDFELKALQLFHFQYQNNSIYHEYCDYTSCNPNKVVSIEEIPFLPISFFKTHSVQTTAYWPQIFFESSGTTGTITSKHFIKNISIYEQSFEKTFTLFFGEIEDYCVLALLPSYGENENSSLIYMIDKLMSKSGYAVNGYFANDLGRLADTLKLLESSHKKTLLIGVTYALLDFADKFPIPLKTTLVMETGGMKGRKKEIIRAEVHQHLQQAFHIGSIASEYGMTELLSQAYAKKDGNFSCPPWMKVLIREDDDPFSVHAKPNNNISGALNIIDLANIYSCSFIATEDIGRLHFNGSFEVLGRLDNSDIRGCSLLTV